MLLSILMTVFGLIALYEGVFFLTHTTKPFLVFEPNRDLALAKAIKIWGIILTIVGLLACWSAWANSLAFLVIMVIIGCVLETLMAYSLMGHFQATNRQK
ncbi:hypothetical protein [Limosilactobacillus frumenti]|nr:hypothetical protein [Limosilactobacillus frumenti]MBA2914160.1 hypothetical protein [Limosilactobacillus frumenti]QFG72309.1 hypothetical protein LF145_02595 [Limosilactobacillus frumenti]